MTTIKTRLQVLEELCHEVQLSNEIRAERIAEILEAEPADERAPRILELLAIARDRRDMKLLGNKHGTN